MAKINLEITFDNSEWKPIKINTETSDKNAYRIFRAVVPKRIKEGESSEQPKEPQE